MRMEAKTNVQVSRKVEVLPDLLHHLMSLDIMIITAQHSIGESKNELITVQTIAHGLVTRRLIEIVRNRQ